MFRGFSFGKFLNKLSGHISRIDHFVFSRARVDTIAVKCNFQTSSIEVFVLYLSDWPAINGVCIHGMKALDIKLMRSTANFFIRWKSNSDFAVWNVRVFN